VVVGFSIKPAREHDHILLEGKNKRSLNWVSLFALHTESSRNNSSSGPALEGKNPIPCVLYLVVPVRFNLQSS